MWHSMYLAASTLFTAQVSTTGLQLQYTFQLHHHGTTRLWSVLNVQQNTRVICCQYHRFTVPLAILEHCHQRASSAEHLKSRRIPFSFNLTSPLIGPWPTVPNTRKISPWPHISATQRTPGSLMINCYNSGLGFV
ncbi:hypothetical protein DFH29DRAFT_131318 [Suillus ampliporus]|nr:hypothetical protein DFH29DRAFT_131318 [Suillus ampliporus]